MQASLYTAPTYAPFFPALPFTSPLPWCSRSEQVNNPARQNILPKRSPLDEIPYTDYKCFNQQCRKLRSHKFTMYFAVSKDKYEVVVYTRVIVRRRMWLSSVAYLEIWKRGTRGYTLQVYIFKSVQILAYFFTLNISTKICSPPKGEGAGARPPKYACDCHSGSVVNVWSQHRPK